MHLETCIKDLSERFARVRLLISPPLVNFRESVVHPAEVPPDAEYATRGGAAGTVEARTPTGALRVRVRAHPLPAAAAAALEESAAKLALLLAAGGAGGAADAGLDDQREALREAIVEAADAAKVRSDDWSC